MNITARNGRWAVALSWPEVYDAYEEGSPAERAIAAVAERHDIASKRLRTSIIRASEDGMTVVVESDG